MSLKQLRIIEPGEKGFVFINPFEGEGKNNFDIREIETIKLVLLSAENRGRTAQAVFEYATLD